MYKVGNSDDITEKLINALSKTKNNIEFLDVFNKSDMLGLEK